MGWFEHRHYWHERNNHQITTQDGSKTASMLVIEECHCGAVRMLEYGPGRNPTIRMGNMACEGGKTL